MSQNNGGDLGQVLEDLRSLSGEISHCAVLSADGELLASTYPEGVETERVRAMLEALYALSERMAAQEGKLHTSRVKVKADEGCLLMQRLDDGGGLFAVTNSGARTGLVFYDMRNSAAEIGRILEGGSR